MSDSSLTTSLSTLATLVQGAQSVLVVVTGNPTVDQLAAGTALTLALQQAGKQVTLATPQSLEKNPTLVTATKELAGISQLTTVLGKQNLVISFAYQETAVDNVSYAIGETTKRFYLTIKPQPGKSPLDAQTVEMTYAGIEVDVIWLIGVTDLASLGKLYAGYEELYATKPIIAMHTQALEIGQIRLHTAKSSCLSEAMTRILVDLQLPLTADIATNLVKGIEVSTNWFSAQTAQAETFEVTALLLKAGAKRSIKPVTENATKQFAVKLAPTKKRSS
jgi:nanoRNase/pAp phosphatase (c-di-AMP/oligoRNAs hydrolase)